MILECFDAWTYTKGERYFTDRAVESWEAKENGIDGKIKGSSFPFYKTKLRLDNGRLIGTCSCPVGIDCKHCVALALQWLEDKDKINETNKTRIRQLSLNENDETFEEEPEYSEMTNDIPEIPMELKDNPIQDSKSYIQNLPRTDLENLASFFMKKFTKTRAITIFSPQFISTTWNSRLTKLDDDIKEYKKKQSDVVNSTPLKILEQITDENSKKQCLKAWFEGYMDVINQVKSECRLRGIFEEECEELYEYYKNEEYDRMEEEYHEENSERYHNSYNRWDYDDYGYLEPYEDFDLDSLTLKSYIEGFFSWLFAPIQDICEYGLYLHHYNLVKRLDYLIKEGIQWLVELKLPTEELGIDSEKILVLMDLKSMIATKLSVLSTFSSEKDQIDHLYSLFIENPSYRNSEIIWSQLHRIRPSEQNIRYIFKKILKNFEEKPTREKFDLLKRLGSKYQPDMINSLLKSSIESFFKALDAEHIIKEIFGILETQPVEMTFEVESDLKQAALKVPTKAHRSDTSLYRRTVDWLVNYYIQKNMHARAFNQLIELTKIRPKTFKFKDYMMLKNLLPRLTDAFVSEYQSAISVIIKKGSKEVTFRLLLDLEKYNDACKRIKNLSTSTYSYSMHHDTKWGAITRLMPHISSVSDKNKELMIKILRSHISNWLSHSSRNRPDSSIAEAISQIRKIYLTFKAKNGDMLWKEWFQMFSNKHWRLRNLRSALNRKGIEMKKS
ncbi:MAG: hypothetical protein GF353_20540 [Candidatus Lokiarchaeota archaeon]|nr:hypothetical protein [Candidatus Lokiarchaeota archaeon]